MTQFFEIDVNQSIFCKTKRLDEDPHLERNQNCMGSDASLSGYGVVIYQRVETEDGHVRLAFMVGKSHVTPLDKTRTAHFGSPVRLETVSGTKLYKLVQNLQRSLSIPIKKVFYYTDSYCLLKNVRNPSKSQKVFIANRIARILKRSSSDQWQFVVGELNPADLCSRGIKAEEKDKWDIYHNGPHFLREPKAEWPTMKVPQEEEEVTIAAITVKAVDDKLSAEEEKDLWIWETAVRVEYWHSKIWLLVKLKKLARIFTIKATKRAGRRRSEEIAQVENQKWKLYYECKRAIFKAIQTKAFIKEQREAKNKDLRAPNQRREISNKSSPLSPHNPFMNKDGLLRVGS